MGYYTTLKQFTDLAHQVKMEDIEAKEIGLWYTQLDWESRLDLAHALEVEDFENLNKIQLRSLTFKKIKNFL